MSAAPLADRPVVLVGFMGAGKSEAGLRLARLLGWQFEDTDAQVEAAAGCSIEEIFRTRGEGHFRRLEWEVLQRLDGRGQVVVAAGGGLFLGVVQRQFLKHRSATVWIDVPLSEIRRRLRGGGGRPLWPADDPTTQRSYFERRRAAYALADLQIAAGSSSPGSVALQILQCFPAFRR